MSVLGVGSGNAVAKLQAFISPSSDRKPSGGTQLATPRWTTVEDFLNDLPKYHCTVKPRHSYCTVCLRINHDVAFDCPLREVPDEPAARGTYVPRSTSAPLESSTYGSPGSQDVPAAVMAEGPLIEFAPSNEPPVKRRMKAKPLDSRSTGVTPAVPAAPARAPPEPANSLDLEPPVGGATTPADAPAADETLPDTSPEPTQRERGPRRRGPQPRAPVEAPSTAAEGDPASDETDASERGPKRGRWRNR